MQVLFNARDPQAAQWSELAVSRVRFAMRRLTWLVPRATVQFSDVNGPRGGVDKCCRVELKTGGNTSVVVTAMAADWRSALENALARASRALLRLWRKERSFERQRHPALGREA